MGKRAVIYVRTSSEQQAEKNSPVEQEADCRLLAEQQGLVVVNVYRDIERYRVKNKWVEPSGTRYDRPGLLAMLRDAADGQFEVILAWREDRLYRGMRAMLLVLETLQQHRLTIMLARESFDLATAPLKAWLAQVELENIKERMTMGVKARLRAGKANSGQDRYGYRRNGDVIEIVPEEAEWVQQIFAWYIEGVPDRTMRKRLIAANAPQKETPSRRRIQWSFSSIQGILASGEAYASGVKIQRREGERFSIKAEPILDMETYEQYLEVKQKNIRPASRIPREGFLLKSLLFCPCNYKMQGQFTSNSNKARQQNGLRRYGYYVCICRHDELISPDCPRNVKRSEADTNVWDQVCAVINKPEILIEQARAIVSELENSSTAQSVGRERIEKELDVLINNRPWVITQARRGSITEEEMDRRLSEMSLQEAALRRELETISETIAPGTLENWEAHLNQYLADMREGLNALSKTPETIEDEWEIFQLKRRVIETLVEKVAVDHNRQFTVTIRVNLLQILENGSGQSGTQGSAGHWPTSSSGNSFKLLGGKAGFKSRLGWIRVSAIWQA